MNFMMFFLITLHKYILLFFLFGGTEITCIIDIPCDPHFYHSMVLMKIPGFLLAFAVFCAFTWLIDDILCLVIPVQAPKF